MNRWAWPCVGLLALTASGDAYAADAWLPPWTGTTGAELPGFASSVAVRLQDTPVFLAPGDVQHRRGLVTLAARLPIFAIREGAHCDGYWLQVGPASWLCSGAADFVPDAPEPNLAWAAQTDGLPHPYYFAGAEGAYAYDDFARAGDDAPLIEMERGWAVAIVEQRVKDKRTWGRTKRNRWIAMSDLGLAHPLSFQGETIADGIMHFAWVRSDKASVRSEPGTGGKVQDALFRFQKVEIFEEKLVSGAAYARISAAGAPLRFVKLSDLAKPTLSEPPPLANTDGMVEKWIDVDLVSQTLVAYEGRTPVFATLVSTGRGAQKTETATPKGVHRIWVKIVTQTMDNVENADVEHHYSIEDVPWVQFFDKGVALHGAFWHKNFGRVQSHGCVNLTPIDAKRLFEWTGPHLPGGYSAAYPTPYEPGTVIRVR